MHERLYKLTRDYCAEHEGDFQRILLAHAEYVNGKTDRMEEWLDRPIPIFTWEFVGADDTIETKSHTLPQASVQWFCIASAFLLHRLREWMPSQEAGTVARNYLGCVSSSEARELGIRLYYGSGNPASTPRSVREPYIRRYIRAMVAVPDKPDDAFKNLIAAVLGHGLLQRFSDELRVMLDELYNKWLGLIKAPLTLDY